MGIMSDREFIVASRYLCIFAMHDGRIVTGEELLTEVEKRRGCNGIK